MGDEGKQGGPGAPVLSPSPPPSDITDPAVHIGAAGWAEKCPVELGGINTENTGLCGGRVRGGVLLELPLIHLFTPPGEQSHLSPRTQEQRLQVRLRMAPHAPKKNANAVQTRSG